MNSPQEGKESFLTSEAIRIDRQLIVRPYDLPLETEVTRLNDRLGCVIMSEYEYPGRYQRWARVATDPVIWVEARGSEFSVHAMRSDGRQLLTKLAEVLGSDKEGALKLVVEDDQITGNYRMNDDRYDEEERTQRPSCISLLRAITEMLKCQDNYLGLYGAFGYDLIFEFERELVQSQLRPDNSKTLALFVPGRILVATPNGTHVEAHYRFGTDVGTDAGELTRVGPMFGPPTSTATPNSRNKPSTQCTVGDPDSARYESLVRMALQKFNDGELFEVVLSHSFTRLSESLPSNVFLELRRVNPSPYLFMVSLGDEHLIGASPEIFVRSDGDFIETCPISGTIARGRDALEDAEQIRTLLNSSKDEHELTMCTDVDRNDKSRICQPGSVSVVGRRQIEMYSTLIHTVDHVIGKMRHGYDAWDAFLTHLWAVTVTGAPKRAAVQFIEDNEDSCRFWYGGAVGYHTMDGHLNTGMVLRSARIRDGVAEVRAGATLLVDSSPQAEDQETRTKANAVLQVLKPEDDGHIEAKSRPLVREPTSRATISAGLRVVLIDHEDSFVHTLASYLRELGADARTIRWNVWKDAPIDDVDLVVLSPGPGRPRDFRMCETLDWLASRNLPVLGVCLGFQAMAEYCGAQLVTMERPLHGRPSQIDRAPKETRFFTSIPESFTAGRYHSLAVSVENLPLKMVLTASADKFVMAAEHVDLPWAGFQFHPESLMTEKDGVGLELIQGVVAALTAANRPKSGPEDASSFQTTSYQKLQTR